MVDHSRTLADIIVNLPRIQLYAVFMRPTEAFQSPRTPEGAETLRQHLLYLFELEEQGRLFASGPLDLDPGAGVIQGMCIVRADSLEEARRIAGDEPYHRAGMRRNEVRSWQLNEGVAVAVARAM